MIIIVAAKSMNMNTALIITPAQVISHLSRLKFLCAGNFKQITIFSIVQIGCSLVLSEIANARPVPDEPQQESDKDPPSNRNTLGFCLCIY